jgi:superfamily II DNA/RNA helicase
MANKSFFLRACKKVDENKKSYQEKAAETRQHSARLADMQRYVDMSEEKRALLLDLILNGKCPDDPNESILHRGAIIYAKYLDVIDTLISDFEKAGIAYYKITGKVSQDQRGEITRAFRKDPHNKVVFISDCASESISLHSSNLLYMYNCPGSAGRANQLWGRTARFGSRFDKFYVNYIICSETTDQYFPILLSSKKELEAEILHADYIDLKKEGGSFDSYLLKEIRKELLWKSKKKKAQEKLIK